MEQLTKITGFILDSFIHIWPYLIITIPLAVIVQITGAAKFINMALSKNPVISIILAAFVGAFSPFCSCGVIPIIASLLIGGVPLAPVMTFWIASPSMDPEIFFLSTATIGWRLSVWRLVATFIISILSGYLTYIASRYNMLGNEILRKNRKVTNIKPLGTLLLKIIKHIKENFITNGYSEKISIQLRPVDQTNYLRSINCCLPVEKNSFPALKEIKPIKVNNCSTDKVSFRTKLLNETWKASVMVIKFMALAFFISALIEFYIPQERISSILSGDNPFSVLLAAVVGVPVYTSNITALPMISALLELGMNKGAALAFLISGPTTTLPAMIAVWGIVRKKIFLLYISYALFGAIIFGLLYNIVN